MCSNTSRISDGFYLTTTGFPAGFNETGSCECTAKSVDQNKFIADVDIVHVVLPHGKVCNDQLLISEDLGWRVVITSRCSPPQIMPQRYVSNLKNITVLFHRRLVTESNTKTIVRIGIGGKYWYWRFPWCSWLKAKISTTSNIHTNCHLKTYINLWMC